MNTRNHAPEKGVIPEPLPEPRVIPGWLAELLVCIVCGERTGTAVVTESQALGLHPWACFRRVKAGESPRRKAEIS
jgi:hypothetical protein